MSAIGTSGHPSLHRTCLLLTQSGNGCFKNQTAKWKEILVVIDKTDRRHGTAIDLEVKYIRTAVVTCHIQCFS
jgi:hypothetical protein